MWPSVAGMCRPKRLLGVRVETLSGLLMTAGW